MLLAFAGLLSSATSSPPAQAADGTVACRFSDPRLSEISGLAPSIRHPGVLWLHNDSGGGPRLYAIRITDCRIVATLTVPGVAARDFEAIATGRDAQGRATIWVGDIGDNRDSWPEVSILSILEPARLRDRAVRSQRLRFTYPDMPHDAETLLAGPEGRLWVVTKQLADGGFYALPEVWPKGVAVAERVGSAGPLVTDGAISPDGTRFVLRDYVDVRLFSGSPPGTLLTKAELPAQMQGEAIAWSVDGRSLFLASEGDDRLLEFPAPQVATGAPSSNSAAESSPAARVPGPESTQPVAVSWVSWAVLALAIVVVIVATEWRRRRSRRQPDPSGLPS